MSKTQDFINDEEIMDLLEKGKGAEKSEIREIFAKSKEKNRLEPAETAKLLQINDEDLLEEMFSLARQIKEDVYGNRIVFFAPLYIGNNCINNCLYCGFRRDNKSIVRKTLTMEELRDEIIALENSGQKRLILVYGEHPMYDADFIVETIKTAYETKTGNGEIRRVNINAAPMDVEGYRKLKEAGIGTFQIFQETYHHETYAKIHPKGDMKSDYQWRLYGLDRALEAGIDDVGIGALFGLYDWKFEVMGLLYHTIHLEETFGGVGPHTISFPRLEPAIDTPFIQQTKYKVSDDDFKKLVAIIRLSVPYTGMILTARESPEVRRQVIPLGVSQIDAGSRIGIGGYAEAAKGYIPEKEQFHLGDIRPLDEVVREICSFGCIPSFCTADYRAGRTGDHFMALAKPGFIHNYCIPNAVLTFKEYLLDYASEETRKVGEAAIQKQLEAFEKESPERRKYVEDKLKLIEQGQRDIYV
ncbi:[FeFe] hydrogenase H-cluster radical SAM maturase HydG [Tepidanaerobacter syntrophicus]|uniref:[FeFe] hydrogenase H-cluster radical SAM maturase HydG n=1 Tax=Tepidanaerobacter syntrophicus TaxID=224999 RepID=UPI0017617D60|nr:[FeFe] hydrogenase H-cluster radical SAM maturase HydG [Tepidanaerobacter syntrophicus]GLI51780.1 [FeFe] hydrogenase H-cluster radical SAM maturase HydG [Tepidanaerobacter syntrophicus]HHV83910.1 [FeFe] hydrogenase H-cluster radical SAM maturase HydG [Tepidanaerobacter syntrophicus]